MTVCYLENKYCLAGVRRKECKIMVIFQEQEYPDCSSSLKLKMCTVHDIT